MEPTRNIIDATRRFVAKSELAEQFEIGENELAFLSGVISKQPVEFHRHLRNVHPSATELLLPEGIGEMETSVIVDTEHTFGESRVPADNSLAVHTILGDTVGERKLRLHVPLAVVQQIATRTQILFADREVAPITEQARLESVAALASWYAMGKWIVDRMQTKVDVEGLELDMARHITRIATTDEMEFLESESRKLDAWELTRQRVAGSLAFRGFARSTVETYDAQYVPTEFEIRSFRAMYAHFFYESVKNGETPLTLINFALANALDRQSTEEFINYFCDAYLL